MFFFTCLSVPRYKWVKVISEFILLKVLSNTAVSLVFSSSNQADSALIPLPGVRAQLISVLGFLCFLPLPLFLSLRTLFLSSLSHYFPHVILFVLSLFNFQQIFPFSLLILSPLSTKFVQVKSKMGCLQKKDLLKNDVVSSQDFCSHKKQKEKNMSAATASV